jgi:hypothetical protein
MVFLEGGGSLVRLRDAKDVEIVLFGAILQKLGSFKVFKFG